MKRTLALALAAVTATSMVGATAVAAPSDKANEKAHTAPHGKAKGHDKDKSDKGYGKGGRFVDLQLLQFSDFHGHLNPEDGYGGAAYLGGLVNELTDDFRGETLLVSSGDSIGGSTFESGLFQDESTVEVLNAMGLDVSAVGNHEFDEGVTELMRMVDGGNHPELGQFGDEVYAGTGFPYLAANVVWKDSGEPILPPYVVREVDGVQVGFIGVVTDDTPILVSPGGIRDVDFLDEAAALNHYAAELQDQGVEAIVGLVHEGGYDGGAYDDVIRKGDVNTGCQNLTGPIVDINAATSAEVDVLLTGHTHNGFACTLSDPAGDPRAVAGPGDWGRVLSQTEVRLDRSTGDVFRPTTKVTNHVVDNAKITPDAEVAEIVDRWNALADIVGQQVVGSTAEPIGGDASGDRGIETPMANLVADSILWSAQDAGAQIAFMNVGGVRASLDQGDVTYAEAYAVTPFGNLINTLTLTGADIEAALNQQYMETGRSRQQLALGVSEGFSYVWDDEAKQVVSGSMTLDGVPLEADETYRVAVYNFLAEGGDGFTAFTNYTELTGGAEDLAAFVGYVREFSPLTAPEDRVNGL